MKTIKKGIGCFFKIVLYPFHILAVFFNKHEDGITLIIPGFSLLYAIYTIFEEISPIFKSGGSGWIFYLILKSIIAFFIIGIINAINLFIINILGRILESIDTPYDYFDAWSRGFTYAELKGYQNYENSTKGKSVDDIMNKNSYKVHFVDFEEEQQRAREEQLRREREAQQRRLEEERRRQEEEKRKQYKTTYETELEKAYKTLHLKEGCSFDEVKKNYRMLVKMFHPDSGRSNFDTTNAQTEITNAYNLLKKHYNQERLH